MTDHIALPRDVVEQVLDYWEQVAWGDAVMADKMGALRAALDEPVREPQGCDYYQHPTYAAGRGVCGPPPKPFAVAPDAYCITAPDGECVSTDPRCMHNLPPKHQTEPVQDPHQ